MPYYMGDFYEGDPGFFSFIGRGVRSLARVGGQLAGLGAPSAATKALPAAAGVASTGIVRRAAGAVTGGAATVGRIISKHPVLSAAAAAGALSAGAGAELGSMGRAPSSMRGFHIELRGKHAGQLIRNRHMRVTNPKALRRALRRAHGFAKLAMKTIHLVHPKKKVRFGGFKKRSKR